MANWRLIMGVKDRNFQPDLRLLLFWFLFFCALLLSFIMKWVLLLSTLGLFTPIRSRKRMCSWLRECARWNQVIGEKSRKAGWARGTWKQLQHGKEWVGRDQDKYATVILCTWGEWRQGMSERWMNTNDPYPLLWPNSSFIFSKWSSKMQQKEVKMNVNSSSMFIFIHPDQKSHP